MQNSFNQQRNKDANMFVLFSLLAVVSLVASIVLSNWPCFILAMISAFNADRFARNL
jgi:hypothetical protein